MPIKGVLKENTYADSMVLMALSTKVNKLDGVEQAMIGMGTALNKQIIEDVGLMLPELEKATPRDLIMVVQCPTKERCDEVLAKAWELKNEVGTESSDESSYRNLRSASESNPDSSLVLISVPGQYAAAEADKAISAGKNVMIFSDNVSIEDELALKTKAHEKGLLVMGPDCGTAIINGHALCFGNAVARGPVGIVAASGTGSQELSVQLDALGTGVSQLVGVGGRDLSQTVGGIMMLDGLAMLDADPNTTVIALISKPPADEVAEKILAAAQAASKPVVICFIGSKNLPETEGVTLCSNSLDTAVAAARIALGNPALAAPVLNDGSAFASLKNYQPGQKYARGLFCGGTICDEVLHTLLKTHPNTFSNIAKQAEHKLAVGEAPHDNSLIDLGSDEFTTGRAHPMIDPTLRNKMIVEAAEDPSVAVVSLDFVLGYGSNEDPVGAAVPYLEKAQEVAQAAGRHLNFVAYVLGTDSDPQNKAEQVKKLTDLNVEVCGSVIELAHRTLDLL